MFTIEMDCMCNDSFFYTTTGSKSPKQIAFHVPTNSQGNEVLSKQAVYSQRLGCQKLHVGYTCSTFTVHDHFKHIEKSHLTSPCTYVVSSNFIGLTVMEI